MVDYTKVTRQGYTVKKTYLDTSGGISTILAVIDRGDFGVPEHRWMWAFAYHFEDGTWGQGHYDYESMNSAIAGFKKSYPRARPINPKSILRVETKEGSFGKFDNLNDARKVMYRIAKHRRENTFITNHVGTYLYGAKWDEDSQKCYMSEPGTRKVWRLYADGHIVLL